MPPPHAVAPRFVSFWMGGFEGADHRNGSGLALDINDANRHRQRLAEDYAACARLGIRTVRESVGWRLATDAVGAPDLRHLRRTARAAKRFGVEVVWTIQHYGVPDGTDRFDADYAPRFAAFCADVARALRDVDDRPAFLQPVNEPSFLAWAVACTGLVHPHRGDEGGRAGEAKRNLVRAIVAGCDAVWSVDPHARIVHTDPLIHVVATDATVEATAVARALDESQFEAWDMIAGRRDPELGGAPRYLDILGLNYYHANQWTADGAPLAWHRRDARRLPLEALIERVHARYARPLLLSETGHVGSGRVAWLDDVGASAEACLRRGVPLAGVCLYPLLDRPDWEDPSRWHDSGLWSVRRARTDDVVHGTRVLHEPFAQRLREWQSRIAHAGPAATPVESSPRVPSPPGACMPPSNTRLVVFSHLRWDFVYQRPQQILSRLAARFPVIFLEEPVPGAPEDVLEVVHPCAGVEVLRPHCVDVAPGFHDDHIPTLREMLADYLRARGIEHYVLWFYTPMAMPLAAALTPGGIVYDCMDELANFRGAARQIAQRESALLRAADLVIAGGRSLFEARRHRHPNIHCFPSAVDAAHFTRPPRAASASTDSTFDDPAQATIPHPRLGFHGVVDERLDLDLVARLADARADWHVVMVGPVLKIDPSTLPRRANLHWLGMRSYDDLPDLVAGWDVCLLPFAINDATRSISPTKTLEYLAADRPVVGTRIADVVSTFGDVVAVADDPDAFVAACEAALAETPDDRAASSRRRAAAVAGRSWDAVVDAIGVLVSRIDATDRCRADVVANDDATATATLVLGAGPTGLAAALHAGADSVLLERNATVGGWCRSIADGGFTFDYAGHIMFSTDPWVLALYDRLLGDNLHWQDREAWIYSKSVYTRYPFQASLHGLPAPVLQECLVGAIEARFGPLDGAGGASHSASAADVKDDAPHVEKRADAQGAPLRLTPIAARADGAPANFEEFIHRVWGRGVAKHFAIPYNRKLWAVPLDEMETSWLGGRVPMPDLEQMIAGALAPVAKPLGPNARFGYPLRGGFQAMMDGFLPLLPGTLETGANVVAVSPSTRTATLDDGRRFRYETLISTLPLPGLVRVIGDEAPPAIRDAAAGLRHVSVRCVNLGIGRERLTDKHWIYYPEDTVFHRVFVQGNTSPHCNAPGGFGLTCEITYAPDKPLPCDGRALIELCIADCVRVGLFTADDPVWVANQVDMPYAYVVYDHGRAARVAAIRAWLLEARIVVAGRYAEWEYYNSDHAFVAGRKAAETARRLVAADDDAVAPAGRPAPGAVRERTAAQGG